MKAMHVAIILCVISYNMPINKHIESSCGALHLAHIAYLKFLHSHLGWPVLLFVSKLPRLCIAAAAAVATAFAFVLS